jgi:hypothetical protein
MEMLKRRERWTTVRREERELSYLPTRYFSFSLLSDAFMPLKRCHISDKVSCIPLNSCILICETQQRQIGLFA